MVIGVVLGLVLGVAAATKQNTWVDYTTTIISVIAVSVPSFVLAVLLQYVFAVKLEWFPVAGWEGFSTAILPSLALSATVLATVARYIRAEMIEVLSSDYILLARAKGNSTLKVLFGHALRNALIPIITIIVPMLAGILTGTLTIENIFGVPGLGDQFVRSITTNDFSVIMATTILFSTLFIVSIFIVDILYGVIDPEFVYKGQEIMSNKEDVTNINGDISNATMSHTSNDISNTDFIIRDLDLNQEPEMPRQSKNFWQDAWSQLKRNKLAVIGMIGLLLIVIMAFIGPLMNKHDFAEQNVDHRNLPAKIPLLDHVSFLPFDGKGTDGKNAYKSRCERKLLVWY